MTSRWRRAAALPLATTVAAVLVTACEPPAADQSLQIELGDLSLTIAVPADHEVEEGIGEPSCVDDVVVIGVDSPGNLTLATTSPELACPEQQPLNGAFPSWGSLDQLPDGATSTTTAIEGATAARFDVTSTKCTNACEDLERQVTFVALADGRTIFVVGRDTTDARYEEMVASIALAN